MSFPETAPQFGDEPALVPPDTYVPDAAAFANTNVLFVLEITVVAVAVFSEFGLMLVTVTKSPTENTCPFDVYVTFPPEATAPLMANPEYWVLRVNESTL
jgi:hypothetical protein